MSTTPVHRLNAALDGQRFLTAVRNPDTVAREIRVVQNLFGELRGRTGD